MIILESPSTASWRRRDHHRQSLLFGGLAVGLFSLFPQHGLARIASLLAGAWALSQLARARFSLGDAGNLDPSAAPGHLAIDGRQFAVKHDGEREWWAELTEVVALYLERVGNHRWLVVRTRDEAHAFRVDRRLSRRAELLVESWAERGAHFDVSGMRNPLASRVGRFVLLAAVAWTAFLMHASRAGGEGFAAVIAAERSTLLIMGLAGLSYFAFRRWHDLGVTVEGQGLVLHYRGAPPLRRPFATLQDVQVTGAQLELQLQNGRTERIACGRPSVARHLRAVVAHARRSFTRRQARGRRGLMREGRTLATWRQHLERTIARAGYRDQAWSSARLWSVAEDPDRHPEERVGALLALQIRDRLDRVRWDELVADPTTTQ
ncbi:MAG: hypothetical protein AAGA56_27990, partial [Myxococcota bacterium]